MVAACHQVQEMQQVAAYRDDGGGDVLASVDDLLNPGNSQGDIHTGHTSKVEGLQRHLGSRLSNTLCPKRTHCGPYRYEFSFKTACIVTD